MEKYDRSGNEDEALSASDSEFMCRNDNDSLSNNFVTSVSARGMHTSKVVFLTVNDVYEMLPDSNGNGGLAELATMIKTTKDTYPSNSSIIVTLNGDFLWRSELDRKDKGALMVELLNQIGIDYIVVGNHEFDFGAEFLRDLIAGAKFSCFGSNVRSTRDNKLTVGLVDTLIIPLRNGFRLGMFGVVTTVTGNDPFAGTNVVFEDEILHARRCVESLKSQGADAIVALTHLKASHDVQLATQVPGINLILGGHDHFPMTCSAGVGTLIHKSGMDAVWLGAIELTLTRQNTLFDGDDQVTNTRVDFQWKMSLNRGYHADPHCSAIILKYLNDVEHEEQAQGKLDVLGISRTALDGRRVTCRTQESNLGNLVADALREGLGADIGLLNAGYIKGDMLNVPGLAITRKWLEKCLPLVKPTVVVKLSLCKLKEALTYWLRRYPAMSSSHPHFSGLRVTYDLTRAERPNITSIRLCKERYEESADANGEFAWTGGNSLLLLLNCDRGRLCEISWKCLSGGDLKFTILQKRTVFMSLNQS
ncbi:hypothetical protein PPTG_13176 [Plasmopara halstedii]|uniref:Uncharacterized protein n=1 Tax=Plasmopara halstedii TaxID=4781 RepID=A0A0N7L3T2_PLAHL|nr:hypothetical protein PPTG_13176 [Plasmopara halstedii]CEG36747.1 hypothetical protein PPTG_13176 [Plasmopara halstedii]|eukprot:XP_024573116.1 hypothetical protein PPTG_13176 [Plasmopara halstedii]